MIFRYACGVEIGDDFIVTGGVDQTGAVDTVGLYSQSGFVRWLTPMNQARRSHGCTTFVTESGDTVTFRIIFILKLINKLNKL